MTSSGRRTRADHAGQVDVDDRLRARALFAALALYVALGLVSAWTGQSAFSVAGLLLLATAVLWPALTTWRLSAWLAWFGIAAFLAAAFFAGSAVAVLDALAIPINALIAWLFGRTLLAGRQPLIARLVRQIEGPQQLAEPGVARYTRVLTWVWTVVLALQALVLLLIWLRLHPGVPSRPDPQVALWLHRYLAWGGYLLIGLLFVGEYPCRRWCLPHVRQMSFIESTRRIAGNWRQLVRDSME